MDRGAWRATVHGVAKSRKYHGQRNLVGYSPYSHKEVDMTEHTCTQSLINHIICKYFVPFYSLSFHFVYGFL